MTKPSTRLRRYIASTMYPTRPDADFDQDWYFANHPDVVGEFTDGWVHFVEHGDAEGRAPSASFDPAYYARTHLGLEELRPYRHYLSTGRRQGFLPAAGEFPPEVSRDHLAGMLHSLKHPIILIGNDAQRAGAPLVLLEIATRLKSRGLDPVFLLKRSGPIIGAFRSLGPTIIVDEGWDLSGMGTAIPIDIPIVGNTGWSAPIIEGLGRASSSMVLVHEMPDYLAEHGLLNAVARIGRIVVGLPMVGKQLAARIGDDRITLVLGALRTPSHARGGKRSAARAIRRGVGSHPTVFLGAGYADARKGFDLFLDAAWAISSQVPNAAFVWLGDLSQWADRLAQDSVARGLPLITPGFQSNAGDWYANAHVYVLTSRQDPGPTTVLDAALVGVPFVGYAADIGIRDLDDVLEGVGEFVGDRHQLVARAIDVAENDTDLRRRQRSEKLERLSSFERYTDEILGILSPPRNLPKRSLLEKRARTRLSHVRVNLARSPLVSRFGRARDLIPFATRAVIRPEYILRRLQTRMRPRVVLSSNGRVATSALNTREQVAAVRGSSTVWLNSPELLPWITVPFDLHVIRERGQSKWDLADAVQRSSRQLKTITRHDAANPPRWVTALASPPRINKLDSSTSPPPVGYPLARRGAVQLARPIGVFAHVYYLDLLDQLIERVGYIAHPVQCYVSTDSETKADHIRTVMPEAIVRVFPNRGRDIYSKVFGFANEHRNHDVVLHVHTKRSPHDQGLAKWNQYILDRLLPSTEGVNAILDLFASIDTIGMVSPTLPPFWGTSGWWGSNRPLADILTWDTSWPELPRSAELRFPAGSMFWARSQALVPVQALDVPAEAFLPGVGGADGTIAHTIERLLGVSCGVAGFTQFFLDTPLASGWSRRSLTTSDVADMVQGRSKGS